MEQLKNLPPFYIGQKVVYITGTNMPKWSKHIVSDVFKFPCGCWAIMVVGNQKKHVLPKKSDLWECVQCGKTFSDRVLCGFLASSFRSLQKQTFPLITYSKIIEKELVSAN